MQDVIAEGGQFGPQRKTLPEETISGNGYGEAGQGAKDAGRYDAGDAKAAVEEEDEGVRDEEEGELGAEDNAGYCYEEDECFRFVHEVGRVFTRSLEEISEGNGHCLLLIPPDESRKGVDQSVPSPKAKKLGSVRDA